MDGIQLFTLSLGSSLVLLGWMLTSGNWANLKAPKKVFKNHDEAQLIHGRLGRRLHMSLALLSLGLAIAVGAFLGREKITAFYWYGVAALALWMSVLAVFDGSATWGYVIRMRRELAKKRRDILSEAASRQASTRELAEAVKPLGEISNPNG